MGRPYHEGVEESVITESGLPPAPGAEQHPSLALVNSAVALPGGHFVDQLGTPAGADQWLTQQGLTPVDAGMLDMCAAQLRSLREQSGHCSGPVSRGFPPCPPPSTRSTTP